MQVWGNQVIMMSKDNCFVENLSICHKYLGWEYPFYTGACTQHHFPGRNEYMFRAYLSRIQHTIWVCLYIAELLQFCRYICSSKSALNHADLGVDLLPEHTEYSRRPETLCHGNKTGRKKKRRSASDLT